MTGTPSTDAMEFVSIHRISKLTGLSCKVIRYKSENGIDGFPKPAVFGGTEYWPLPFVEAFIAYAKSAKGVHRKKVDSLPPEQISISVSA